MNNNYWWFLIAIFIGVSCGQEAPKPTKTAFSPQYCPAAAQRCPHNLFFSVTINLANGDTLFPDSIKIIDLYQKKLTFQLRHGKTINIDNSILCQELNNHFVVPRAKKIEGSFFALNRYEYFYYIYYNQKALKPDTIGMYLYEIDCDDVPSSELLIFRYKNGKIAESSNSGLVINK